MASASSNRIGMARNDKQQINHRKNQTKHRHTGELREQATQHRAETKVPPARSPEITQSKPLGHNFSQPRAILRPAMTRHVVRGKVKRIVKFRVRSDSLSCPFPSISIRREARVLLELVIMSRIWEVAKCSAGEVLGSSCCIAMAEVPFN